MKPWLFDRRDEPGVVGFVARWWTRRRVARIRRAMGTHR